MQWIQIILSKMKWLGIILVAMIVQYNVFEYMKEGGLRGGRGLKRRSVGCLI